MAQHDRSMSGPDLYAVLGIGPDASAAQVSGAFRTRVRELHPDTAEQTPASAADLQEVLAAWQILRDPERRAAYDRARASARSPRPARMGWPEPDRPAGAGPAGTDRPVVLWIGQPVWIRHRRPNT